MTLPTLEKVETIRAGVPVAEVWSTASAMALPVRDVADLIGTNVRTLQRRRQGKLSKEQSDRVYRLQRLVEQAEELFGSHEDALAWLKEPARGLGGRTPLSLLDTSVGEEMVSNLLAAIDYGVYQ